MVHTMPVLFKSHVQTKTQKSSAALSSLNSYPNSNTASPFPDAPFDLTTISDGRVFLIWKTDRVFFETIRTSMIRLSLCYFLLNFVL